MMNDKLNDFVKSMGALTEMWTMTYQNFIKQGYSVENALTHTREFMAAFLIGIMSKGEQEENK